MLVFDDGLGGFLPLSAADLSCEPLSLASAGIVPAPSTLMVMAEGVCVVKQTRRALYRHWQLADGEEASVRGLLARAARLVAEITLGRGELPPSRRARRRWRMELATQGLAAAWPLGSSLRYYREQWERHVRRESCPEGLCLERRARALPRHLSGQHRHPELHGPPRPWRLSRHHRGHPARQPAAADLRPGLPGAVRICLRARRQRRRRLHPADEGQGGRALPRRGRLPEARDRARHRQADRHRRLRPLQPHRGLLPAHPTATTSRSSRRRKHAGGHAALRHPGLPPAARPARAGARPDPRARRPDPHQRPGREPRGLSARTTTPSSSASARRRSRLHADRRVPINPSCSAASTSCAPCAAASRCGSGRGSSSSAAATSPSTSP
ncbi:MAG: hypothetical protein MZV65_18425 [Chromatiales bacterium]|nr:hypothetical protein [Chromatiales bacterium]